MRFLTSWVARFLVIAVGVIAAGWILGQIWTLVFPVLLAVLLTTVLLPPTRLLAKALPEALAALISIFALLGLSLGLGILLAPQVRDQTVELISQIDVSLDELLATVQRQPWAQSGTIDNLVDEGIARLQQNGEQIASTIINGVLAGAIGLGSLVVTLLLTLILTFFFCKDGQRFLPWVQHWTGETAAKHVSTVGGRIWQTLSGFIWAQATVSMLDAVLIGLGLWLLDVPFALALAVLIFFAGFVPIVGAVSTGLLAVVIALISQGPFTALAVLGVVLVVQQVESNLLQPVLVGRVMTLHPLVVLGSVTAGGSLAGITGAFLAVPIVSVAVVSLRYLHETLMTPPSDSTPSDPTASDSTASDPTASDPA